MYHYDPTTALEELTEDATLPNPVHVRDMILRKKTVSGQIAGVEPVVCRVSEVFWRDAEAGERDFEAALFVIPSFARRTAEGGCSHTSRFSTQQSMAAIRLQ
jgi:hypothetical protein